MPSKTLLIGAGVVALIYYLTRKSASPVAAPGAADTAPAPTTALPASLPAYVGASASSTFWA